MQLNKSTGATIAAAAAMLFSTAPLMTAAAAEAKVHCTGVNACKGQSSCKSAHNACKGQNSCKGQGWVEMSSKQECDQAQAKMKEQGNKPM